MIDFKNLKIDDLVYGNSAKDVYKVDYIYHNLYLALFIAQDGCSHRFFQNSENKHQYFHTAKEADKELLDRYIKLKEFQKKKIKEKEEYLVIEKESLQRTENEIQKIKERINQNKNLKYV